MTKHKRVEDKQRFGCIYMLTNLITLLCYIGKTIDFEARMGQHKRTKTKTYLSRSIQKHGWHNFKKEIIIDDVAEEALNNLEIYYIAFHNTMRPYGYNLTRGGEGTSGYTYTTEQRENCKEAAIRREANRDQFGTVYFDKTKNKYVVRGPPPYFKHIGRYFTKEKAQEVLNYFLQTGERIESDIKTRKKGTGNIRKSGKRYRAQYMKNKKFLSKAFDTPEQCEEWLKLKLNL